MRIRTKMLSWMKCQILFSRIHRLQGPLWLHDCILIHQALSKKGILSKRKEFAPTGSKIFPLRIDPFKKGEAKQRCLPRNCINFPRETHYDTRICLCKIERIISFVCTVGFVSVWSKTNRWLILVMCDNQEATFCMVTIWQTFAFI